MFDTIMPDCCLGERFFGHCKFPDCFKGHLCLHLLIEGRYKSSMGLINKITHFTRPQQIIQIMYPVSVPVLLKLWNPSLTELCRFPQFRHHYFSGKNSEIYILVYISARQIAIFKHSLWPARKDAECMQKAHSINI